jgi:LCP family protein required for cell wall assembly
VGSNARSTYRSAKRSQRLLTAGLLLAFAVVVVVFGALAFDFVYDFIASSGILPDLTIDPDDSEVGYEPGQALPVWTGTDRVTVLLLGIDRREGETAPARTDSMLLLTIDPVVQTAAALSIPRDLWVPIPMGENSTEGRINAAHYFGELYDWPGGGPGLAVDTVEYNLGVQIDYYARVDFQAFERLVDLIGGVRVYVEEEIWDPEYPDENYGFDPLHIPGGWQDFDGAMALKYARVRHGGSDYDRVRRQHNVLRAIFDKVTRLDMIASLAPQAAGLWETFQDSVVVSPDLSLTKIIALARLASEVDEANLGFYAIDQDYTVSWTTQEGQIVEIPQRDRIRELRDHIFTAAPEPIDEDAESELEAEAARVEVLNGTLVAGLASETAEQLRQAGVDVVHVGNADRQDYTESLIMVYGSGTFTAEHVSDVLGLPRTSVVPAGTSVGEYDIVVILGGDYGSAGG